MTFQDGFKFQDFPWPWEPWGVLQLFWILKKKKRDGHPGATGWLDVEWPSKETKMSEIMTHYDFFLVNLN